MDSLPSIPHSDSELIRQEGHGKQKWADQVFSAFAKEVSGKQKKDCIIQSLCSGMGTEHMAMKVFSLALENRHINIHIDISDPKKRSPPFCAEWCHRHQSECSPTSPDLERVDFVVAGFPCAPFSSARIRRHEPGRWLSGCDSEVSSSRVSPNMESLQRLSFEQDLLASLLAPKKSARFCGDRGRSPTCPLSVGNDILKFVRSLRCWRG